MTEKHLNNLRSIGFITEVKEIISTITIIITTIIIGGIIIRKENIRVIRDDVTIDPDFSLSCQKYNRMYLHGCSQWEWSAYLGLLYVDASVKHLCCDMIQAVWRKYVNVAF